MLLHSTPKIAELDVASRDIVIIGNALYDLRFPLGEIIDSFENVMRFNTFSVVGHEKYVGSKTTIWCYCSRAIFRYGATTHTVKINSRIREWSKEGYDLARPKELIVARTKLRRQHREKIKDGFAETIERTIWKSVPIEFKFKNPSTGICGVVWAISKGYKPVVIGFNGFMGKESHHYWESFRDRGTSSRHPGNKEREFLVKLHREGKIYLFNNTPSPFFFLPHRKLFV